MRHRLGILWVLVLLTPALAGCLGNGGDEASGNPSATSPTEPSFPRCEHPWPCADGTEWPRDLQAPSDGFQSADVEHVRIPMDDGVALDGAILRPDLPEGTAAPVLLWATPYAGQCRFSQVAGAAIAPTRGQLQLPECDDAPADSEGDSDLGRLLFEFVGSQGYAIAIVSVRGTGLSGGCHDFYGARSQQDMAEVVTWLADRPWSNGRVGMWGLSAMGTTPWMAAVEDPPALKAIAPSGIISDLYLNRYTPQGAPDRTSGAFHAGWAAFNSEGPPGGAFTGAPVDRWSDRVPYVAGAAPDRICPEALDRLGEGAKGQFTDERDPGFWDERRLVDRFGEISAAALVMHGFDDIGHAFQEDAIWPFLSESPKRMVLGQWGHAFFFDDALETYPTTNETRQLLLTWFDFWLKGLGDPPRVGLVDYQVRGGSEGDSEPSPWRTSTAWPPTEVRSEVLYLDREEISVQPGEGSLMFQAQPVHRVDPCEEDPVTSEGQTQVVYVSPRLEHPVVVAGNPMAYLRIESTEPGGVFGVSLYAESAGDACEVRHLAEGAVDLRFHEGNAEGRDFPTNDPVPVRVDLWSTADGLEAGERIMLVLSGPGEDERLGQLFTPAIEVGGRSHIVLPLLEGTLGGELATQEYPSRPRVPTS